MKKSTLFALYFLSLLLMGILHFSKDPDFSFLHLAIHLPSILGVISIFFAILVPLLKKKFVDLKPAEYLKVHHLFSYIGWSSVFVHMIFLYVWIKKFTLFVPSFADWATILSKSGPIAVILILLGGLGLFFRKRWTTFQLIHSINMLAFFWITVHGIFKDKSLEKNPLYLILLLSLDLLIIVLWIINRFQTKRK